MIRDADFDRILTGWLSEGSERAPAEDVAAALAIVATTPQRRTWNTPPRGRQWTTSLDRTRIGLLVTALLLLLAALAIGVGAGLIRMPSWLQDPAPPPPDARMRPVQIEDWPVRLSLPSGWTEIETPCCDYRHFAGTSPEGHLSVGHESPFTTAVCSPDCQTIELPMTIPYSASTQLDALKASVAAIAGSSAWTPIGRDVLAIDGGARLDTTALAADGRAWRRVHIVGLKARNVVAIGWSQPVDRFDDALLASVLDSIELTPAPVYSDGDLIDPRSLQGRNGFVMPIPGLWNRADQPTLDGQPLSGVLRYEDGRVVVSIGDVDGALGWCDPDCRQLTGQTSLDVLERTIREGRALGPAAPITLGGEPARMMGTEDPVTRRYVVAIHHSRPVAMKIETGEWDVAPGIVDEMIAGFSFTDPVAEPVTQTFTVLDGRATLGLSDIWKPLPRREDEFILRQQRLSIHAGGDDGTILTCELPVAEWELCREVRARDLEDLEAAIQPGPIQGAEFLTSLPRREVGRLDGEPCVITTIQAFESASKGLQEVVYIVAMHDGRPYILRIRTTADHVRDLQSVLEGFHFVD